MANSPAESAEDRERFVRYAHLVMSAPSLTNPDRAVLVESADDAQPPIDPLVHAHLASMIRICKEHESRGPRLIELIGEGHAALSRARLTFDAVRDGDFAVYASSRIRETLELAIAEHGRNPNEVAERDDGAAFRLGPRH
jgi:DNA-directed RNA polymerase sigma subunit (sigma70/sigma32)